MIDTVDRLTDTAKQLNAVQGELNHLAVVVNEPVRRWRVTGTDLLPEFALADPVPEMGGMGRRRRRPRR